MVQTSKVIAGITTLHYRKLNQQTSGPSFSMKAFETALHATVEDDQVPKRKRKRKKKVQAVDVEDLTMSNTNEKESKPSEPKSAPPALELKPFEDVPVELEVQNILASSSEPEPSAISTIISMFSSITGSNDRSMTPESSTTEDNFSAMNSFEAAPLDDSLDQLLEDARLMTEEEKEKKGGVLSDEDGAGVKAMIGNALSTIVTADFFVVCGFLAWFLLGIFCSYILKDDTIQIAFNNNFEKLVQPALGVLMIAAIGGSFFKEEEQEYDL